MRVVAKNKRPKQGKSSDSDDDVPVLPKAPERIASPFRNALEPLKKQLTEQEKAAKEQARVAKAPPPKVRAPKPARAEELTDDDTALSLAMHGVVPLDDKKASRVGAAPRTPSRRSPPDKTRSPGLARPRRGNPRR